MVIDQGVEVATPSCSSTTTTFPALVLPGNTEHPYVSKLIIPIFNTVTPKHLEIKLPFVATDATLSRRIDQAIYSTWLECDDVDDTEVCLRKGSQYCTVLPLTSSRIKSYVVACSD